MRTASMIALSAVIVSVVALLRWWLHPGYAGASADLLLFALFYFLVLSLVSGSFDPSIIEWSRRQARFRISPGTTIRLGFKCTAASTSWR